MKKLSLIILFMLVEKTNLFSQSCNYPSQRNTYEYSKSVGFDWQRFGKSESDKYFYDFMYLKMGGHDWRYKDTIDVDYDLEVQSPWELDKVNVRHFRNRYFSSVGTPNVILPDNLYADGWELIKYNFGLNENNGYINKLPYFILYNKYTAIMRVFVMVHKEKMKESSNTNVSGMMINLTFFGNYSSALLSHASGIINGVEDFEQNITMSVLNKYATLEDYNWLMADFVMAYDPCTCKNPSTESKVPIIQFSVDIVSKANLQIVGKINGTLTTESTVSTVNGEEGDVFNDEFNTLLNMAGNLKSGGKKTNEKGDTPVKESDKSPVNTHKTAPAAGDKVCKIINNPQKKLKNRKFANEKHTSGNVCPEDKNRRIGIYSITPGARVEGDIEPVVGVLGLASTFYPPLAPVAVGVAALDFFLSMGSPKEGAAMAETQTTLLDATLTAQGTITSQNLGGDWTMFLPGSKHSDLEINNSLMPIYDRPLGVFNLLKTPEVEYIQYNFEAQNNNLSIGHYSFSCRPSSDGGFGFECGNYTYNEDCRLISPIIREYRLKSPLEYIVNPYSDLDVVNIEGALIFRYNEAPATALLRGNSDFIGPVNPGYAKSSISTFENYETKLESQGIIIDVNPAPTASQTPYLKDFIFRTRYFGLGCLNQASAKFFLYDSKDPDIYVKLIVTLRKKNPQSTDKDILMVVTYNTKSITLDNLNTLKKYTVANRPTNIIGSTVVRTCSEFDNMYITSFEQGTWGGNVPFLGYLLDNVNISTDKTITQNETVNAVEDIEISANITANNNSTFTANAGIRVSLENGGGRKVLSGNRVVLSAKPSNVLPSECQTIVYPVTDEAKLSTLCNNRTGYYKRAGFDKPAREDVASTSTTPASRTSLPSRIQAIPNPSYGTTTFYYTVPEEGEVRLYISNTVGQPVATLVHQLHHPAGQHSKVFHHRHLPTGIYFYTLTTPDGHTETQRLVLLE